MRLSKKKTISKLKKELDTHYSRYIRLKNTDHRGMVSCVSCHYREHWKKLQCGHFISRRHSSTRYDERNTKPQCFICNMRDGGNLAQFALELQKEYGDDVLKKLYRKSQQIKKFTRPELEKMISDYKEKVNSLDEPQ